MQGRSLDELPHEILLSIVAQLEKETSTLAVLLRVNRFFFRLAAPILWADPFKTTNKCCMMRLDGTSIPYWPRSRSYGDQSLSRSISLYEALLDPILRVILHPSPSLKFRDMHSRHVALLQEYDVPTAAASFAQEQARPETEPAVFTAMTDQNCQQQLNQQPSINRPTGRDYLQYLETIDLRCFPADSKATAYFREKLPVLKDSQLPPTVYQVLQTLLISRYPSKIKSLRLEARDLRRQDSEAFSVERISTIHVRNECVHDGLLSLDRDPSPLLFHRMANLTCLIVTKLDNESVMWARLYACLAYHQSQYGTLRELGLFMTHGTDADEKLNKVLRLVPRIETLRLKYRREVCRLHPIRPRVPRYTWKGSTDVISGASAAGNGTTSTESSGYWDSSSFSQTACGCCWQSSWYSDLPNTSLRVLDIEYLWYEAPEQQRWIQWRDLARFKYLEELHIQGVNQDMFEWILEETEKDKEDKVHNANSMTHLSVWSSPGITRNVHRPLQHLKRLHFGETSCLSILVFQRCNVILGDQLEELSLWIDTIGPRQNGWRFHAPFPKLRSLTLKGFDIKTLDFSCIPIVAPRLEVITLYLRASRFYEERASPSYEESIQRRNQWVQSTLVPSLKQLQHLCQIKLDGFWVRSVENFKKIVEALPRLELLSVPRLFNMEERGLAELVQSNAKIRVTYNHDHYGVWLDAVRQANRS